jgi:hypothetical protein
LAHAARNGARPHLRVRSTAVPELGSVAFDALWPLETSAWLLAETGAVLAAAKIDLVPGVRGRVVLECTAPPARLVIVNRSDTSRDVAFIERPDGTATVRTLAKGETWRSLLAATRSYDLIDVSADEAAPRSISPRAGEVIAVGLPLAATSQASSQRRP